MARSDLRSSRWTGPEHTEPAYPANSYFISLKRTVTEQRISVRKSPTYSSPPIFKVFVEHGTFADQLSHALDELDASGKRSAPTFALIDPFGFKGIPYSIIKRLLAAGKCEVMISLMADSMNRWLTHPGEKIQDHIIEAFGTEEALALAEGSSDRVTALKDLYQIQLKEIASFVRYFEMRDNKNRIIYYLFFASNNSLDHLKMKEAMWKVDPQGEFTFSDATDPGQQLMFSPRVSRTMVGPNSAYDCQLLLFCGKKRHLQLLALCLRSKRSGSSADG